MAIDRQAPVGTSGKIVVVEHDRDAAQNICRQLTELSYQVCGCVDGGAAAIATAAAARPDLVLINPGLPGDMGGIAAAQEINDRLSIPLLFLGDLNDPDTIERSLRAQPYAFLPRTPEPRELHDNVRCASTITTLH